MKLNTKNEKLHDFFKRKNDVRVNFLTNILIFFLTTILIVLLVSPYAINGFWWDDMLNSQIFFMLQRVHGELFEFTWRVVKVWLLGAGRLMFNFFYAYPLFYFFNELIFLKLAHCIAFLINISLYGYMLWILGATLRLLIIWAIFLVGLFQINGVELDPLAGFCFHYPMLGIQLTLVLILFIKWLQTNKLSLLIISLILWLLIMTAYEINIIFIPIAFMLMVINGDQYKKYPAFLLIFFTCAYLALNFYIRSHATGTYPGSEFGLVSKMGSAYLKQVTASLPGISYLAITHKVLPIKILIKQAIDSGLAWCVFVTSLVVLTFLTKRNFCVFGKKDVVVISVCMVLLPAVFPAISLRYQSEVIWGGGTLPVYYQNFGLAFFAAWLFLKINTYKVRLIVSLLISGYLALNVTMNYKMVEDADLILREPRESFITQAKAGLLDEVLDGDIIYFKNLSHDVNSDLIFEATGKRVYDPKGNHTWYPESSGINPKTFVLLRKTDGLRNYSIEKITPKNRALFLLHASGKEILHTGYEDEASTSLALPPIKFEKNMSIEVLVESKAPQVNHATILSNHNWRDISGITIESVNIEKNEYIVAFGSGKSWMEAGRFNLKPDSRNLISIQVSEKSVNLYVNGVIINHAVLPDSIAQSAIEVNVGNWEAGDRPFQGLIEEVFISDSVKTAQAVLNDTNRLFVKNTTNIN